MIRKPHKYRAKATVVDGVRFASQKEARRYCELKLLEKAGEITALELQPEFPLCAGDEDVVIGCYRGDFAYVDRDERWIVEDVKSAPTKTALYRWKIKHLFAQYGIEISEL